MTPKGKNEQSDGQAGGWQQKKNDNGNDDNEEKKRGGVNWTKFGFSESKKPKRQEKEHRELWEVRHPKKTGFFVRPCLSVTFTLTPQIKPRKEQGSIQGWGSHPERNKP
jgi:hypothetical protein